MTDSKPFEIKEGLFYDIPSEQYHRIGGTFSSSQLKDAVKDIEFFHRKHILKTVEREENTAFELGTYVHTAILEPEKLQLECAVFEGIRRGEKWETFKTLNSGKAIITKSEKEGADNLIKAIRNSPVAMGRINRSQSEVSAFLQILVYGGEVFAPTWKKVLSKYGWVDAKVPTTKGTKLWIKCRADKLGANFILDVKTTSGNAKSERDMQTKVSSLSYDLSAAMYLDVFSAVQQRMIFDFVWTFASKDFGNCKNYLASEDNILIGRAKWKKAILAIADGFECNWEFDDSLAILKPAYYEYENIRETGEDAL